MFQKRKTLIYIIILSVITFISSANYSNAALEQICLNNNCIQNWSQVQGSLQWATSTNGIYNIGNVGIGADADSSYKLYVINSGNSGIYSYAFDYDGISGEGYYGGNFYGTEAGINSYGNYYGIYSSSNDTGVYGSGSNIGVMGAGNYGVYASGGTYDFYAASGNRSYFSGKLGIGVDNNAAKLAVAGDIDLPNTNNWRYIKNSATNGGLRLGTGNSGGSYTDGIEITSGGGYIKMHHNVGIGVGSASPSDKLDVVGYARIGASTEKVSLGGGSIGINRRVETGAIFDNTGYAYQFNHTKSTTAASDYLAVQVYNNSGAGVNGTALTINGAGNVGIGVNSTGSKLEVAGDVKATSITLGGITKTAWSTDAVQAPIYTTSLYGTAGDIPVRTTSNTPVTIRTVYGPLSYAQPNLACPTGTTKKYKIYTEYVDNITSGGQKPHLRLVFDQSGKVLDLTLDSTWGSSPSYRTWVNTVPDYFLTEMDNNHVSVQIYIQGVSGPYMELRKADLLAYCI